MIYAPGKGRLQMIIYDQGEVNRKQLIQAAHNICAYHHASAWQIEVADHNLSIAPEGTRMLELRCR